MVLRLFRIPLLPAPAADRLARTEVLSIHHRSMSMSPLSVQPEPQPVQKSIKEPLAPPANKALID